MFNLWHFSPTRYFFFFSVRPSTFLVIFYIKYTCVNSLKNLRQQNVVILIKAFDGLSLSLEVSQLVQDVR